MAILSNELRIGNLVMDEKNRVVQIHGIESNWNYVWLNHLNGSSIYCFEIERINPILLTPEILEKCGFNIKSPNKDGTFNYWSKELDASIDCEDGNLFRYRIHEKLRTKNIVSLHQLQNLYYALTQTELTYKL